MRHAVSVVQHGVHREMFDTLCSAWPYFILTVVLSCLNVQKTGFTLPEWQVSKPTFAAIYNIGHLVRNRKLVPAGFYALKRENFRLRQVQHTDCRISRVSVYLSMPLFILISSLRLKISCTVVMHPLKPPGTTRRPSFGLAAAHDFAYGMQIVAFGSRDQVHLRLMRGDKPCVRIP